MAVFEPVIVRGLARAMHELQGQKRPFIAGHKLLYRCNLECKMCPFWRREDEKLLSLADEIRMMESLARAGVSFLGFEGGEPLLRKDVAEILREAHHRFHTSLVTNGWLLANRLGEIKDSLESLFVSLDGIGPMHDFLRGIPRSFERAVAGIRAARESIPTAISSTITKENMFHAEPLVELAESLDVSISFGVAYDYSTADRMSPMGPDLLATLERLGELKRQGAPIIQSKEYFAAIIDSWFHGVSWRCKPWLTINVDPRGRLVMPCYVLQEYSGDTPVWDVDIAALWNSFDWTSFESCNKCALSCYLEPSLFDWTNASMVRERIVGGALSQLRRGVAHMLA